MVCYNTPMSYNETPKSPFSREFEELVYKAFEENFQKYEFPFSVYYHNRDIISGILSLNGIPAVHEGQVIKVKKGSKFSTHCADDVDVDSIKFVKNEEEDNMLNIELTLVNGKKHTMSIFDGWGYDGDGFLYMDYYCMSCNPHAIKIRNLYWCEEYYVTLFFGDRTEDEEFLEARCTPDGFWNKTNE